MPTLIAPLKKMPTTLESPVQYTLALGETNIPLNSLLGQKIQLRYTGHIHCIQCNRKTNKSFHQGHCFPCYRRLVECGLCTIYPEKCRYYEEGVCKLDDWAHAHCAQPHVVYLANSSGLKVGVTREKHFTTRWIDQGATQGLVIFKTQNRHQAGLIEVALKKYVADKTNWQAMLKSDNAALDLMQRRDTLLTQAQSCIDALLQKFPDEILPITDQKICDIQYPVSQYPLKIKSFDLDKDPLITGTLHGIKGQYLILDTGVVSIRKFGGYQVEWA